MSFMYNLSKIVASYIIAKLATNDGYKQYYALSIIGGNFSNRQQAVAASATTTTNDVSAEKKEAGTYLTAIITHKYYQTTMAM